MILLVSEKRGVRPQKYRTLKSEERDRIKQRNIGGKIFIITQLDK